MSDGVSQANASSALSTWTGNWDYTQLHTGAPGSAFTANVSSTTTRESTTWGSPSNTSNVETITASNEPTWSSWAGTNGEVDTDISGWSAASSGTGEGSMPLSASVTMDTGDSLELTQMSISVPTAA